ncbi:MAG: LysR family transcriptional regulator [Burkholderiales bacterium]|nr:LysR family transcriptional regulator [Burkholderiales bacterium]
MNKLQAMTAFVRVAESGSFTAAAAQLGISVSAVAKAVARLEEELSAQLLARSTRRMSLNDDGRKFYARCQQILNDIEDAEASVRSAGETPRGRLRMALPVLFGRLTFLPRVAEFTARYPDIVLDVGFDDRAIDLIERGVDLAVQVGALDDSRCITRVLNHGPRVTAATPDYLERHGAPAEPGELAGHDCIISNFGPVWKFSDRGRLIEVPVRGNLVVSGGDAVREAVLLGLGIAQSNWWTLRHDLAAGTLRPLLERYAVEGQPISVVYPPTRHVPRKLRVMIDFLVEITRLPESGPRKPAGGAPRGRGAPRCRPGQTVSSTG